MYICKKGIMKSWVCIFRSSSSAAPCLCPPPAAPPPGTRGSPCSTWTGWTTRGGRSSRGESSKRPLHRSVGADKDTLVIRGKKIIGKFILIKNLMILHLLWSVQLYFSWQIKYIQNKLFCSFWQKYFCLFWGWFLAEIVMDEGVNSGDLLPLLFN